MDDPHTKLEYITVADLRYALAVMEHAVEQMPSLKEFAQLTAWLNTFISLHEIYTELTPEERERVLAGIVGERTEA